MAKRLENVLIGERKSAEITEPTPIPTLGKPPKVRNRTFRRAAASSPKRSESNDKDKKVEKEGKEKEGSPTTATNRNIKGDSAVPEMKKRLDILWAEVFPPISDETKMFKMQGK